MIGRSVRGCAGNQVQGCGVVDEDDVYMRESMLLFLLVGVAWTRIEAETTVASFRYMVYIVLCTGPGSDY